MQCSEEHFQFGTNIQDLYGNDVLVDFTGKTGPARPDYLRQGEEYSYE